MSAKKLADALLGWDEVSEALIRAARHLERHGKTATTARLTTQAILETTCPAPGRVTPLCLGCMERLFMATGYDQTDLAIEEAIDNLVAAAFWKIP